MRVYAHHLLASLPQSRPTEKVSQDNIPTEPGDLSAMRSTARFGYPVDEAFEAEVRAVMKQIGIEEIQARQHVRCRRELAALLPRRVR